MHNRALLIGAAALVFSVSAASAAPAGIKTMNDVLVDANGMTLYIFDNDTTGVSNCYDKCAANWPPLMATDADMADGDYSVIERTDGTKQWAYDGMPLYFWVNDTQPGDTTGDGVGGVWHVVAE